MHLAQLTALGAEQALQAIEPAVFDAVVFQAIDQGKQQRIGLLDRRLRLRGQGLRKVGQCDFLVMQVVLTRGPGLPGNDHHHRQAHGNQQGHCRTDLEPGDSGPAFIDTLVNGRMPHDARSLNLLKNAACAQLPYRAL
ncbi:hypothetical protein D3C76_1223640 [compost metagenome]